MEERLQKIMARSGLCSRRRAEELIREGKVTIDGTPVTEMGLRIDPALHRIEIDGSPLLPTEKKIYLLLNKPKGYVSTVHDPQNRPTITRLVQSFGQRLFPVGRLDQDTEGALILTNDGDFAHRILHPSFEINRTYQALVRGIPSPRTMQALATGIDLDGRRTWPAKVRLLESKQTEALLEITIHEGRKRQIRMMCAAVGHPVLALKRTAYGPLQLGNLAPGRHKVLTKKEIQSLLG